MTRIVVHIDRLVLRGLNRVDRAALMAGLRQELGRRFAEPQAWQSWTDRGDVTRLPAGRVALGTGLPSHEIGVRVGRAVAGGVRR